MTKPVSPERPDRTLLADIARFLRSRRAPGYLVGGAVRDALMGRASDNLDIAVKGLEPLEVAGHLHKRLGFARPVVFARSKTVFTNDGRTEVEVSPLRGSLKEDVLQRDFTVNCLYVRLRPGLGPLSREKVFDPTGLGLRDLKSRTLRAHPDPFSPLAADPVRLLRAVRFRAVAGFSIETHLEHTIGRMAFLISRAAPERVRTELERILVSCRVLSSFRVMERTGLLEMILPEVARTAGFEQGSKYHAYDLLTHTLKTVAYVKPDLTLRLAALLHDTGKVSAQRRKGKRFVYYGHEKVSAVTARGVLSRLRFPGRTIREVSFLIENHMVNYSASWTDAAVRRFIRKMGSHVDAVLSLAAADRRAHAPEARMGTPVRELRRRIAEVTRRMEERQVSLVPIDGRRIMQVLAIGEGPQVGEAKEYLCQVALRRGRRISPDEAARLLKKWATRRPNANRNRRD